MKFIRILLIISLVTWMLPGNLPHIGIVNNETDPTKYTHLLATYQIHYDDYIFAPVVKSPKIAYFFEVRFFTGMNIP